MKSFRITMGNSSIAIALLMAACLTPTFTQAQFFKKIQQKLEDKASAKADNILNGKKQNSDSGTTGGGNTSSGKLPYEEEVSTFKPGSKLLYSDSLTNETIGTMPGGWKTHSSGAVAVIEGVPGKWLSMREQSSYRIDSLLAMPRKFTLEFDLLTRSDKPENLRGINFGFSGDNSARSYIYGVGTDNTSAVEELNFNYNTFTSRSYDNDNNNRLDFPLNNFGNAIIHMAIVVEGEHMRVYLNKCKMLDADMFNHSTAKYFYISTEDLNQRARAYISNLKIAEI